jgi:uracil-DNA glycosylase family 4
LVRSLHKAGFANQPVSESRNDGLVFRNCYVTAAVKCAPPGDRPTRQEFENCSPYLDAELRLLKRAKVVLALGSLAFNSVLRSELRAGEGASGAKFAHGARYALSRGRWLFASYHPSPRNTNTGKLSHKMLVGLLKRIRTSIAKGEEVD